MREAQANPRSGAAGYSWQRQAFSEGRCADAIKKAAFDEALRSFLICLDDATSRTQARGTLTIPEVNDLLVRLNKEWQVVESFGLPVDPARVEETARIVEVLRNELDRLQKSRVTTIAAVAATILILLVASGWFVSVQYRAGRLPRDSQPVVRPGPWPRSRDLPRMLRKPPA